MLLTARDDVPGFVVLAVSTAARGATTPVAAGPASHAAAANTTQPIVPLLGPAH